MHLVFSGDRDHDHDNADGNDDDAFCGAFRLVSIYGTLEEMGMEGRL